MPLTSSLKRRYHPINGFMFMCIYPACSNLNICFLISNCFRPSVNVCACDILPFSFRFEAAHLHPSRSGRLISRPIGWPSTLHTTGGNQPVTCGNLAHTSSHNEIGQRVVFFLKNPADFPPLTHRFERLKKQPKKKGRLQPASG